jgi:hypothetical protein
MAGAFADSGRLGVSLRRIEASSAYRDSALVEMLLVRYRWYSKQSLLQSARGLLGWICRKVIDAFGGSRLTRQAASILRLLGSRRESSNVVRSGRKRPRFLDDFIEI